MTAIQQDVETQDQETKDEVVIGNIVKNEAVEEIAKKIQEEREKDLGITKEAVPEPEPEKEPKKEEVPEPEKPKVVKIKVDGEEREVPEEKIVDAGIRAMQKESTADKRLEEATRLLREIEQKYAQPKQETPSQEWDDQTIAYALEHGTEEQKAYAVSQLRGRNHATPEEVAQIAEARVLDKVDFREASDWFLSEYKDIAGDPYLAQLAVVAEQRARATGDKRSRKELYKSIGEDIRKWKGGITATDSFKEKTENKSKIVNLPAASVKKTEPQEAKPKTPSEVIAEMRKARGQK